MQSRLEALGPLPSFVLVSLCGWLFALGAPPDGVLLGYWLAAAPFVLVVRRTSISVRYAACLGLAGGLGVGLGGFPWITELLVKFAGVPVAVGWLGLLGVSLWMAVPYALWAVGIRIGPHDGSRADVWAVALFVALQSLWPNLFPYSPILGFAEAPAFMQLAEVFGVHFVEAIVIGVGLCIARAVTAEAPRIRVAFLAAALAVPPLLYGYGHLRMAALDAAAEGAPRLVIGLVQPNVPVGRMPLDEKLRRLWEPSAAAEAAGAELVVWPEAGAYPFGVERPYVRDPAFGQRRVLSRHRVQTIFGVNSRDPGARFGYNTVVHLGADGVARGTYDKVNLVPLGESIPLIDPDWVTDRIPTIAHHHAGTTLARFDVGAGSIHAAPLICYEDIIPGFVRAMAAQPGGVELFVNVTIDAWYGDSAEPWEHLALAQFRSIEHRIPMVRAVSSGVSAVVDYNGRLAAHIPLRPVAPETLHLYPAEVLVRSVVLPRNSERQPTPFARFGWMFPHLCQVFVALALVHVWVERRKRLLAQGAGGG